MSQPPRLLGLLFTFTVGICVLSGCASRSQRFEAVGPDGATASDVHYALQSDEGQEGRFVLSAKGRRKERIDGRETDVVRVTMVVDNFSDDSLAVPLSSLQLSDDAGRSWRRAAIFAPPPEGSGASSETLVVPAGARSSAEIVFDAGAPGTLRTTGSVTLAWQYSFRGKPTSHATRFLPVQVRRVVDDPYYWNGGFNYWGGAWGYRPRFGFGYGRRW